MPWRLARNLLRETSWLYLLGVAAFCLLLSIDFLSIWAEFLIDHQAGLATVARLMVLQLPWFLHLSLPVAVVFAVLLATGRLARDSELKAAYALGVPPPLMLLPLLALGLAVSALALLNNGFVEPLAQERYNRLVDGFFYARPPAEVQSNVAYALPDQGIFFASRIKTDPQDPGLAELSGVLVVAPDGTTLSAERGEWDGNSRTWRLLEAQRREPAGAPELLESVTLDFVLPGQAGSTLARRENLSLPELSRRIDDTLAAGGRVRELRFDFQRRVADAFSALVFVLVAGAVGLGLRGRAGAFAWTIALLVAFWATWTLAGNLFETGVLGPAAAAWLTPALVALAGVALAVRRLAA